MTKFGLTITFIVLLLISSVAHAFDFTADVVSEARGQQVNGKIYVAGNKVRMDMAGSASITRMDKGVAWVLMPQQLLYVEQPIDLEKVAGATEKMPGEVERTSLGPDMVSGRKATKYRIVYSAPAGQASVIQWVDDESKIPVKTAAEDGSWMMEYRNLKVGPQDASVFEVPPGYKKFSLPNMADMMRATQQQMKARSEHE